MKIAIVVLYFGEYPNYFQLFLNSCKANCRFDWLIFSDNTTYYDWPENVQLIPMSFTECRNIIQEKFPFKIELETPQKLCDFRCAYGHIFEEYLKKYAWWGHCDIDQVFGDLDTFITDEMLNQYEKIYSLGHLTLYRNTEENNLVYQSELNGEKRYQNVFSTKKGCAFDEWYPGSINEIYLEKQIPVFLSNACADINPYITTFTLVQYNVNKRIYEKSDVNNSIFRWENGHLYQLYIDGEQIVSCEYPYVHLQKRKMCMEECQEEWNNYYIIPNRFINRGCDPLYLLKKSKKWRWLNYQLVKVKLNNLMYRIKSGDWEFRHIFGVFFM